MEAAPTAALSPVFRRIYDAEFDWLYRTVRRLGARDRDLEDLTHDVLVVAYRRLGDYDPARPLRPWLFGIAFRVVSDYKRRAAFYRESVTDPHAPVEPARPARQEAYVAEQQRRELILQALDALSDDQRAVFVSHELDELPIPEIALAMDISENTLYSRLRLARKKFSAAVMRLTSRGRS